MSIYAYLLRDDASVADAMDGLLALPMSVSGEAPVHDSTPKA